MISNSNSYVVWSLVAASAAALVVITAGCGTAPTTALEQTATAPPANLNAKMATFDREYQAEHRGQIRIQVPEVYELVNVAIALTPFAQEHASLVQKDTPYFDEVVEYFAPFRAHPLVRALDEQLRTNVYRYRNLKMNGYAFEFRGDQIVPSAVYTRTSHPDETTNDLLPLLPMMQDFSEESQFRAFYAKHAPLYHEQEEYLRTAVGAEEMMSWLRSHFPDVRGYDTVDIIFSPLAGSMQSSTWMESNGFRELQPHIALRRGLPGDERFTPKGAAVRHGFLLFTELNHGFIEPLSERFGDQIDLALSERDQWVAPGESTESYSTPRLVFDEMMNWGLVSLYVLDKVPEADTAGLIGRVETMMEQRGFVRFKSFNRFLLGIYRQRPSAAPVSSLYPQIIKWFQQQQTKQGAAHPARPTANHSFSEVGQPSAKPAPIVAPAIAASGYSESSRSRYELA